MIADQRAHPGNTLRVTDPGGLTATRSFTVTVGNSGPTLNSIPDQTVQAGNALTFTAFGSDPDGDPISVRAEGPRLDVHWLHHAHVEVGQKRFVPAIVGDMAAAPRPAAGEEDR